MQHTLEVVEVQEKERKKKMDGKSKMVIPIVSKIFCSSSQAVFMVRRRPHAASGGGFVVTDCTQKVVFKVDGCGVLGTKGELILRDGNGEALLLARRKEGIVQALSIYRQWRGYNFDYEGMQKMVFKLKEPKPYLCKNNSIKIYAEPRICNKDWDFEINGSFPDKDCSIVDHKNNIIAQIGMKKEVEKLMESKDVYHVVVKPGIDQAFVLGVIAVLDNIYGESTIC